MSVRHLLIKQSKNNTRVLTISYSGLSHSYVFWLLFFYYHEICVLYFLLKIDKRSPIFLSLWFYWSLLCFTSKTRQINKCQGRDINKVTQLFFWLFCSIFFRITSFEEPEFYLFFSTFSIIDSFFWETDLIFLFCCSRKWSLWFYSQNSLSCSALKINKILMHDIYWSKYMMSPSLQNSWSI